MSLPLPGSETVSLAARPSAIFPAGPYPVLGVAEVRQLGLSDGQIVRPTVEVRNERLTLLLDGRVIEWPGGAPPRVGAGSPLAMTAWMVRLLANGSAQLLPVRGREAAPEPPVPAAGLPRSDTPGAAAAPPPQPSGPPGLPPRWAQLLVRPATLAAWTAAQRSVGQCLSGLVDLIARKTRGRPAGTFASRLSRGA